MHDLTGICLVTVPIIRFLRMAVTSNPLCISDNISSKEMGICILWSPNLCGHTPPYVHLFRGFKNQLCVLCIHCTKIDHVEVLKY